MGTLLIIVIALHFLFDWILQPREIAKNKKKNEDVLMTHMLLNILPFSGVLAIVLYLYSFNPINILAIITLNMITHFIIDGTLPSGKNEREMINWTAIDQILHISILIFLISTPW